MKHILIITKTEYTLNGVALDTQDRMAHSINRMNRCANPEIVKHETVLLSKSFTTAKAAWAYATLELVDSLGVVYSANGNIGSDAADYSINVIREDKV
mgnify:FL=1